MTPKHLEYISWHRIDEKINPKQYITISLVRIGMLSAVWDKEKSEVLSLV